jgi:ABC-type transport system involved in cytochrome bd biosynthesis fused ATPase/permease subunit
MNEWYSTYIKMMRKKLNNSQKSYLEKIYYALSKVEDNPYIWKETMRDVLALAREATKAEE